MQPRLSRRVKCLKTTSLQLVTDAGDRAVERLSPTSSTRPHSSTVTYELLPPPSCIARSLCKVDGQGYPACALQRSREASNQTTAKLISPHLFEEFTGSSVFSTRHTNQQILTLPAPVSLLSVGLSRANSSTATAQPFILTRPPYHPQAPVCTYSTAFSTWGGLDTSKHPVWELQWGDKKPQPRWAE